MRMEIRSTSRAISSTSPTGEWPPRPCAIRTLVSNIPGAIYRCAYDADWTMEFIIDEVAEITGYPPSDFVDKVRSYASVIHFEDRDDVARTVHESVREGQPYVLEYRVVTAGGKVRWVYEKGQAVLGPEGEPLWLDGAIF